MLHGELVESLEADAAGAQALDVRRLTVYIDQCLTGGQGGCVDLGHHEPPRERPAPVVAVERLHLVAQDEVVANTGSGQRPDAVDGFGQRQHEAEVDVAVVPPVRARRSWRRRPRTLRAGYSGAET